MSDSLLVYPIDRHLETAPAHSTKDTAQHILQLPAWSTVKFSRSHLVRSYIQFPPPLAPDDCPLYCHDPDLTLLTLEIHYIVDIPEHGPEFVQYAMFIPISTIKTACVDSELTARPLLPRAQAPSLGGSPTRSPHIVQWADWGPAGTRIVHFDSDNSCYFSAMGCSCAVTQRRRDAFGNTFLRSFVFDVHPWASPNRSPNPARDLQHAAREEERRRFMRDLTEKDTLAGLAFTESLRTTFPFDVTRRDIPLTQEDRIPIVVLAEDGILLVMCRALMDLIDGDVSIQTKIELARSGRIDGTPSVTVTVADRLASLRQRRARFHAGDHPLKYLRGRPFGFLSALSYNGFVTIISAGIVHHWRPPATFSGLGEQEVTHSMRELQLEGFNASSCVTDIAQDLLVFSRKDPTTIKGRPHPDASQSHISLTLASEGWQSDY
ncbi:hypothetical protein GSI_03591 [Ganoderma sinense ZZ0214-1]|uniref:Uncharacterized protein n=1 Tax=Ganoderma sinense ZZ0214-1 TaxID=1077348 RepID=A0A2G8SJC8_9APHY|nr:hypothetical protein GSI_03591 [Ganoderma sinense ZZ0214-1]